MEISALHSLIRQHAVASATNQENPSIQKKKFDEVCRQFEAYFTSLLLSSMVETSRLENKPGTQGMQEQWAWGQMVQTISSEMAQGQGMGLAEALKMRYGSKIE